jgi:hypothetical protein
MRVRFAAAIAAFGIATAGFLVAGAQAGYADIGATSGAATAVTSTSAMLNGVVLAIAPSSAWVFQYGTSTSYGHYSTGSSVGLGLTAVSQTIRNLAPDTTYHFRLVLVQGNPGIANDYSVGDDRTFTTPPATPSYGTAAVESHLLSVQRGVTAIHFTCDGSSGSLCRGKVTLAARAHGRLINCGTDSLLASAGHHDAIASRLSSSCLTLLGKARDHTVRAELRVTLDGTQKLLTSLVTIAAPESSHAPRATVAATPHRRKRARVAKAHHRRRHARRR